jgi:hypothetical protein
MRALALSLFVSLCFCACGPTEDPDNSDESSIQGGHADSGDGAVGLLWLHGGGFCSGVLISPSVVLTAGHCVAEPIEGFYTGEGKKTTQIGAAPASGLTRHAVAAQLAHPSFSAGGGCPNQTFDVGLVRLAQPIGNLKPMVHAIHPPSGAATCRTVGYGVHNSDANDFTVEQKRAANVNVRFLGSTWLEVAWQTGISDHGDSGGPLICSDKVAGVTSCGTDGTYPNHKSTYYARVDNIATWIDTTVKKWQ